MTRLILAVLLWSGAPAVAADPVSVVVRTEADGSATMTHETVVDASAAAIWAAIASAEGWKSWAVPVAWTPAEDPDLLETSYSLDARPGGPGNIKQRFVARIPGRLLAFRTVQAPQGFPDFDTYAKVVSVIELTPVAEAKTRVRLTGTGYAGTDAGKRLLGFFRRGNSASLEMLRTRFADGPIDWTAKLREGADKGK